MLVFILLIFLGGMFYLILMLVEFWCSVSLVNLVVYLVNGLCWMFYGKVDVDFVIVVGMIFVFFVVCVVIIVVIFCIGWWFRS